MPLVVTCPKCHRRYDATGRPAGGRFRCRCGAVLVVGPTEPPPAGAAHGAVESLAAKETDLLCPVCQSEHRLASRNIEGCDWMECRSCAGLWIDNNTFEQLLAKAETMGRATDDRQRQPVPLPVEQEGGEPARHGYVPCPVCHQMMTHQNFEHRSGVIVDVCRNHGIWFDAHKLTKLLDWVRTGGLEATRAERQKQAAIEARIAPQIGYHSGAGSFAFTSGDGDDDNIARWIWPAIALLRLFIRF